MARLGRLIASARSFLALGSLVLTVAAAQPAQGQGTVSVTYRPPLISLEARDAALGTVLGEVGSRAGFSVVQSGLTSPRITIAVRDVTLEDLLRQLLRSENHTLLYRAQPGQPGGVLDQIVLLGAASSAPAQVAETPRPSPPAGGPGAPALGTATPLPASPGGLSHGLEPPAGPAEDAEPTLGDVLRSHAAAGLRAAEMAREPARPEGTLPPAADPVPTPAPPPVSARRGAGPPQLSPEAQEALAATTRQAQQSLKALVDGLEAATQSLQQPSAPPRPR